MRRFFTPYLIMRFLSVFFVLMFMPSLTFAYLDPGTGSILVQGLIAAFAAGTLFFSNVRYWIMENIFRRKRPDADKETGNSSADDEDQNTNRNN